MSETTERFMRIELERLRREMRAKGYDRAQAELKITADKASLWLRTAGHLESDGPSAFKSAFSGSYLPYLFLDGSDAASLIALAWAAVDQMKPSDTEAMAPWFDLDQGTKENAAT